MLGADALDGFYHRGEAIRITTLGLRHEPEPELFARGTRRFLRGVVLLGCDCDILRLLLQLFLLCLLQDLKLKEPYELPNVRRELS